MAVLIPVDPKFLSANWSSTLARLTVTARNIPGYVATADFKRLDWMGGRKLRLEGFFGGLGNPPPFDKTYTEDGITTKPKFEKVIVVHADLNTKKETTSEVSLTFENPQPAGPIVPLKPQSMPAAQPKNDPSAVILQAITVNLAINNFVRITAPIPNPAVYRYTIDGRNDADNLYTWRSGEAQGLAYWDVAWNWMGNADTKNSFTVTTTQAAVNQASGPTQTTVQQYIVKFAMPTNANGPRDLSDPNA